VLVPGVKDTPRSTSPQLADRTVTNCSPAGSAAADSSSVIATSLFGSAPWSPLPDTVDEVPLRAVEHPLLQAGRGLRGLAVG
jgi:hypothetical protein